MIKVLPTFVPVSPFYSNFKRPKIASFHTSSSFTCSNRLLKTNKNLHNSKPNDKQTYRQSQQPRNERTRNEFETDSKTDTTRILENEALDPSSGSTILSPSYNIPIFCLAVGPLCIYLGDAYSVLGFPLTLLGALIFFRCSTIRFVFGPTRFSVAKRAFSTGELTLKRGFEYTQFINWEIWWKPVPILAYFKEKESYFGRGGVHFFPVFVNPDQLREQFKKRTPHIDKPQY